METGNGHEFTSEEHYRRGLALLEGGHGSDAFEHLSRAYLADPQSARFRSAYALGLALVKGQFLGAVELARAAVRQEFYNPDLYLNLARIYLTFDCRAEAVRYLRRGLMVDPESDRLRRKLGDLGIRRRPPIRFLPRGHLFNRLIGRLHSRVAGPVREWAASPAQGA
jgi:tetratricopeptide (TPR) repeat protein